MYLWMGHHNRRVRWSDSGALLNRGQQCMLPPLYVNDNVLFDESED